jgi:hypothetical protein
VTATLTATRADGDDTRQLVTEVTRGCHAQPEGLARIF